MEFLLASLFKTHHHNLTVPRDDNLLRPSATRDLLNQAPDEPQEYALYV